MEGGGRLAGGKRWRKGRGLREGKERKWGIFGHEGGKVTSEDEKREEAQRRRRRKRKAICRMKEDKDFPKKDGV